MTLPLPRAVREFVGGVRSSWTNAFPKADPRDLIYALNRLSESRGNQLIELRKRLESERKAHEAERAKIAEAYDGCSTEYLDTIDELRDKLSDETAARKETERELYNERVAHEKTKVDLDDTKYFLNEHKTARKEAERKLATAWNQGFDASSAWADDLRRGILSMEPENPYAPESLDAMEKAKTE